MLAKLKKTLCNNRGEGYIDAVVVVLVVVMMIAFAVSTLPVFLQKANLNIAADKAAQQIEVIGSIDSETYLDVRDIARERGLTLKSVTITPSSGNIQLNEDFEVLITAEADLSFGPFTGFKVPLESAAIGRSQVYWK
jgi:hypothetical protein